MYDIAIIGAGPAGMSAAIYARRAGLAVVIFEGEMCGGQMAYTPEVENYPGFARISGAELAYSMREQMLSLGAELVEAAVSSITAENGYTLTAGKETYTAKALIIANGAKRRKLGIPGEEQYSGRGVSYCAVCDGMFFRGKTVAVIGGGNTALEDALYLAGICEKVYLIHRRDEFRAQKHLTERVLAMGNIEILYSAVPTEIRGEMRVNALAVQAADGERVLDTSAVFVAIGLLPENEMFTGLVELENGYICAGEDTHTSRAGVFAAGDTRTKTLRQVVTAAADGAMAATEAEKYLQSV
ncbi:MAG: thioredoxin-disulfide reductase [Clostridia bacterium]|nr:thioredoxin-disulfide reductase [Clostridia bacterium]